jgi:aminomethyltransferase
MLFPEGTFVDDVIVHRLGEDDYLLVINAGTREKDIQWVRENTKKFDCVVEELSDAFTQLAIQGPRAVEVVQKLTDADLSGVKNYWFTHGTVCGLKNTLIARTGYTGEDGFEIYVLSDVATSERVWNQVMEAGKGFGIVPCGLGARNTLRLESKMALYGHEISDKINVWEAGLDRYCKMEKGDFVGRPALERAKAAGLTRTLVGLEMIDRGIARDEYCCCNEAGERIGVVTSGSPSPTLGKNIALAYVPPAFSTVGTIVYVEIRGQKYKAQVVATPFYKRQKKAAAPNAN